MRHTIVSLTGEPAALRGVPLGLLCPRKPRACVSPEPVHAGASSVILLRACKDLKRLWVHTSDRYLNIAFSTRSSLLVLRLSVYDELAKVEFGNGQMVADKGSHVPLKTGTWLSPYPALCPLSSLQESRSLILALASKGCCHILSAPASSTPVFSEHSFPHPFTHSTNM